MEAIAETAEPLFARRRAAAVGEMATLIGSEITIDEVAAARELVADLHDACAHLDDGQHATQGAQNVRKEGRQ